MSLKAVIFDWGGVLVDDPTAGVISFCAEKLKVAPKTFEKLYLQYEADFQTGLVSETDYWKQVCAELKVPIPDMKSLRLEALRANYFEKREVFDLIHPLKCEGYSLALLSNTDPVAVDYFHERGYDFFDLTVFSNQVGLRKPDPEIYNLTLKRLALSPDEVVFIDDREENIKAALQLGWNGILFQSSEQLIKNLLSFC